MTGRLPAELAWMLPLWGDGSEMRTAFPTRFLCSTARRARETWQLAAVALGAAVPVIFDHDIYGASPAGLIRMRARFPAAAIAVLEVSGPWSQLGPGRARLTGFVTPGEMGTGGTGMRVS
jgi:phosphohistidine phosphatase SixA